MNDEIKEINEKLNVVIAVMLKGMEMSQKEKVLFLNSLGLSNGSVAAILGSTPAFVAKEVSISKKRSKNE